VSFDIVIACRRKDIETLRLALPRLRQYLPHREIFIFTAKKNFTCFFRKLGSEVELMDEDTVFPDMTLRDLKQEGGLFGFPGGAGWYFQQFLKFSYPRIRPDQERYLIWDADTVPLRPFQVFGKNGRALLTPATTDAARPPPGVHLDPGTTRKMVQATRIHKPYFENYRHLLGESPTFEGSFIAQQMPIHVPTLKRLLDRVEQRFPGGKSWPWKVIQNLRGRDGNLFSEYEFYAQFALQHAPEFHEVRPLLWSRAGRLKRWRPSEEQFTQWADQLDYVALERWASPWRRILIRAFHLLPESLRSRICRNL